MSQDQLHSQIVLFWVQQNLAVVLRYLGNLKPKAGDVFLNEVFHWPDSHVRLEPRFLAHVVIDHFGAF